METGFGGDKGRMTTDLTADPETAETAPKHAQWEQFGFRVEAPGMVEVANESHDNPLTINTSSHWTT